MTTESHHKAPASIQSRLLGATHPDEWAVGQDDCGTLSLIHYQTHLVAFIRAYPAHVDAGRECVEAIAEDLLSNNPIGPDAIIAAALEKLWRASEREIPVWFDISLSGEVVLPEVLSDVLGTPERLPESNRRMQSLSVTAILGDLRGARPALLRCGKATAQYLDQEGPEPLSKDHPYSHLTVWALLKVLEAHSTSVRHFIVDQIPIFSRIYLISEAIRAACSSARAWRESGRAHPSRIAAVGTALAAHHAHLRRMEPLLSVAAGHNLGQSCSELASLLRKTFHV